MGIRKNKYLNYLYKLLIISVLSCDTSSDSLSGFSENSSGTGIGGSMARFTIVGDHLYTVDAYNLNTFDISDQKKPGFKSEIDLGWGIETIFPYKNRLFIGAQSGMHIYDLKNQDKPSWISTYEHMTSCDPVVVQDNYAFVTLRGGNECMGFNNQLDIIDISKIDQPILFKTYEMVQPHGLGVDNNCLFITEGEFGLKMFDISNLNNLKLIEHFKDISSIDVIPFMNVLMVIGDDGFHQYSYDCEKAQIEYISTIPIVKL